MLQGSLLRTLAVRNVGNGHVTGSRGDGVYETETGWP